MNLKNEKQVLLLIKYALPVFMLTLSIIITTFLYFDNKTKLAISKEKTKKELLENKKQLIKEQVNNISNYIMEEQQYTEDKLKESLIKRVHEAHKITTNIYDQFHQTHTKKELTLIIKTTLKDIRFNNNRGYFFVYDKKATNIIHPLVPKLEGKNLINYKDTKGTFVLKESIELLKNNDESYQEWYWRKTKGDLKEYKKIGFVKNIYELDWFLGTGEYVADFSKDIQKKVIEQISKFRFGENGYFIITDKNNNYISHINKDLIGKNALKKLRDINDLKSVSIIEKTINKKKGFIYLKFYKPNSKKVSEKVIYLKTIPKWNWTVSTGFYEDDLIDIIKDNQNIISQKYNETLKNVLIISSLLTLLLMFLSFYISRIIEKKFNKYKKDIAHHINKNQRQHELLAQKTKLAAMGEMIENIAHQWRQPLSVITTASTGMKLHKDLNILDDIFFEESIISINSSANHLSDTIEDFRDFFKPDKEKTHFTLNDSVNKMTKLLSSHFKDEKIEIILKVEDIHIYNFERELLQVLLNIMSNARDAFKLSKYQKYVFIDIYKKNTQLSIEIKDNAGGIKEDIIKRVFEPYFTTKHQSQGTGIGLYMSQEIISKHMKGTIEVENITFEYKDVSYTGAKFTITLPV